VAARDLFVVRNARAIFNKNRNAGPHVFVNANLFTDCTCNRNKFSQLKIIHELDVCAKCFCAFNYKADLNTHFARGCKFKFATPA